MKEPIFSRLKNKTVVIVTQQGTTGPSHDVRDVINPVCKRLLFVGHPLLYLPENFKKRSEWMLYEKGKITTRGRALHWRGPELLLYIKDFCYSLFWTISKMRKVDIFIGVGNLNALCGILLKKCGVANHVVFYCIDFVPVRFSSKVVNDFYHAIDRYAVQHADVVWNLSPRMREGRRKRDGQVLGHQITVPIGIWYKRIARDHSKKVNPHEMIFLGTLLEKQGIDLCIDAVGALQKEIPDIRFTIIGSGPYESQLRKQVQRLGLTKHVRFEGYISSHRQVEKRLSQASLAVALYNPDKDTFSYYADPGKVKVYLACGLPILITDIPYVARQVKRAKCGIVVRYNLADITAQMRRFLKGEAVVLHMKKNAAAFAKAYDWPLVVKKALAGSNLL